MFLKDCLNLTAIHYRNAVVHFSFLIQVTHSQFSPKLFLLQVLKAAFPVSVDFACTCALLRVL